MTRLLLGLSALTLLSACGVQGDLARPDPLWNHDHAIASECHRERTHREHLDARCRQTATVQPQTGAAAPPQSPTAPENPATPTTTP
ncbi:MAG: hypothetical protein QM759_16520 [Terricaulis sp.]